MSDTLHVIQSGGPPMFGVSVSSDSTGAVLSGLSWDNNFAIQAESVAVYVNPVIECQRDGLDPVWIVLMLVVAFIAGIMVERYS